MSKFELLKREGAASRGVAPLLLFAALAMLACGGAATTGTEAAAEAPVYGSERDGSPSWSPDGSRIVFYTERDGNAEIYVMDADGSNPVRLTEHPANDGYPAFSPDGERISFDSDRDSDVAVDGGTNYEIYTMSADGSDLRRLTYNRARDVSAAWSPDGSQIAWISDRSGRFEVWLMNVDGSDQRQLTGAEGTSSDGTHWYPQFSPDGLRLAFHVNNDVYTVGTDGSEYTRLTVDPANGMVPTWSPDSSRIVFMSWRSGAVEIYVMPAEGGDPTRLTHTEVGESIDPRWSPDGSKIVYTWVPSGGAGPKHIMLMNADGSGVRQITGTAR